MKVKQMLQQCAVTRLGSTDTEYTHNLQVFILTAFPSKYHHSATEWYRNADQWPMLQNISTGNFSVFCFQTISFLLLTVNCNIFKSKNAHQRNFLSS